MEVERKKHTGQTKSEESKRLLQKLREQLYASNGSIRRQAAFHLSWLQEDGLEALKGALFGDCPTTAKNAAAYGLRKMRGRMKKAALEVFHEGLEHQDGSVREVCTKALILLGQITPEEKRPVEKAPAGKLKIKEISRKTRKKTRVAMQQTGRRRSSKK